MIENNIRRPGPLTLPSYNLALPFSERRALLIAGDVALLALAGFLAPRLQTGAAAAAGLQVLWLAPLMLLFTTLLWMHDCYDLRIASQHPRILRSLTLVMIEIGTICLVACLATGQRAGWLALMGLGAISWPLGVIFLSTASGLLLAWRLAYIQVFTSPAMRRRGIVVGAGQVGSNLVHAVRQNIRDYTLLGIVDDRTQEQSVGGLPLLGRSPALPALVRQHGASEVIVACAAPFPAELHQALIDCHEQGVMIKPLHLLYEEVTGRVPVEGLESYEFLAPLWSSAMPTVHHAAKRALDVVVALAILLIALPLLPIIALAIYLDNPGPIFYRQVRVGKGGKHFQIIKFRSMIANAERPGKAVWASRNDPRITRVGRFIRRTRLDELPQLLNILRGEMSLVGPRPERPEFVSQLQQTIPYYRTRLSVLPGLTGWAQVQYRYGNTTEDALVKLQHDLYYVKHQSIVLDLLIILRTIKVVLAFGGM